MYLFTSNSFSTNTSSSYFAYFFANFFFLKKKIKIYDLFINKLNKQNYLYQQQLFIWDPKVS